jgi:hypothetical protein
VTDLAAIILGAAVATLVGLFVTWAARRFVKGFRELLNAVQEVAELPREVPSLIREVVTLAGELAAFRERVEHLERELLKQRTGSRP